MRKLKIDLNKYEVVTDEKEADLVIIPLKESSQVVNKVMFKSLKPKNHIVDTEGIEWKQYSKISIAGEREEYNERVNWWYDNVSEDYKNLINSGFHRLENIPLTVERSKQWLLTCPSSKRKSNIHNFLQRWLNREWDKQLSRSGGRS